MGHESELFFGFRVSTGATTEGDGALVALAALMDVVLATGIGVGAGGAVGTDRAVSVARGAGCTVGSA